MGQCRRGHGEFEGRQCGVCKRDWRRARPAPPTSPEVARRRVIRDSTKKYLARRTPEHFARKLRQRARRSVPKPAQFLVDPKGRVFHTKAMMTVACRRCGSPPTFGPCPTCAPRAARRWAEAVAGTTPTRSAPRIVEALASVPWRRSTGPAPVLGYRRRDGRREVNLGGVWQIDLISR